MTGGQASSSTPANSYTSTTVGGRTPDQFGYPLDLFQLASHPGVSYFRRLLMNDKGEIEEFGKSFVNAVAHQMKGTGLSIIEILCACPSRQKLETAVKMSKVKASRIYSEEVLAGAFPIDKRTGEDFADPLRVIKESCLKKVSEINHSRESIFDKCLKLFKDGYSLNTKAAELSDRELTVVLSGRGGQGIQTIAELLFRIWTPVFPGSSLMPWYTPEVRNATTSATLKISRARGTNPAPQSGEIDALLCMSQDGIEKYKNRLSEENGLLIFDPEGCSFDPESENLSDKITVFSVPATAISRKEFGNPLYSNMILTGFLLKKLAIFTDESAVPAYLGKIFSGVPANHKAFLIGYEYTHLEN
jgi:Pyruvate/2-oxoacid:ferredoxin oxidoreductase gamma subunit